MLFKYFNVKQNSRTQQIRLQEKIDYQKRFTNLYSVNYIAVCVKRFVDHYFW